MRTRYCYYIHSVYTWNRGRLRLRGRGEMEVMMVGHRHHVASLVWVMRKFGGRAGTDSVAWRACENSGRGVARKFRMDERRGLARVGERDLRTRLKNCFALLARRSPRVKPIHPIIPRPRYFPAGRVSVTRDRRTVYYIV